MTTEKRERYRRDVSNIRQTAWAFAYKGRMRAGLERCRECDSVDNLTLGHLIPVSLGGRLKFNNITILCQSCNVRQGSKIWKHLVSLEIEEQNAPLERRWSKLVRIRRHFIECPVCEREVRVWPKGKLATHIGLSNVNCSASQQRVMDKYQKYDLPASGWTA